MTTTTKQTQEALQVERALKLALEALECALSDDRPYIVQCKEAITAIREALAHAPTEREQPAQQQEPVARDAEEWGGRLNQASWAAIEAWDAELMGPMSGAVFNNIKGVVRAAILKYVEGYTSPQPAQQQEPEGVVIEGYEDRIIHWRNGFMPSVGTKLYTSPPASKPWVGLTKEERVDFTLGCGSYETVCAIEAKLREKNA